MTRQQAIEWVEGPKGDAPFVRSELEAACEALVCDGGGPRINVDQFGDDDLWLICRAELKAQFCIADTRDVLVSLADLDVLPNMCLRTASMLVRLRAAIYMRQYDPSFPVTDAEAATAYKQLRHMLSMSGE